MQISVADAFLLPNLQRFEIHVNAFQAVPFLLVERASLRVERERCLKNFEYLEDSYSGKNTLMWLYNMIQLSRFRLVLGRAIQVLRFPYPVLYIENDVLLTCLRVLEPVLTPDSYCIAQNGMFHSFQFWSYCLNFT